MLSHLFQNFYQYLGDHTIFTKNVWEEHLPDLHNSNILIICSNNGICYYHDEKLAIAQLFPDESTNPGSSMRTSKLNPEFYDFIIQYQISYIWSINNSLTLPISIRDLKLKINLNFCFHNFL